MTQNNFPILPLYQRVAVKECKKDETVLSKGGILMPVLLREQALLGYGEVVAVGQGYRNPQNGQFYPVKVNVGDFVYYDRGRTPDEVRLDGEIYYLINESDIVAIDLVRSKSQQCCQDQNKDCTCTSTPTEKIILHG